MFELLTDASVALLSLIPKVYEILGKTLYDFLFDLSEQFNVPSEILNIVYDLIDGVLGEYFDYLGLPLGTTPLLTVILSVGIVLSIIFSLILFLADVIDRFIPV